MGSGDNGVIENEQQEILEVFVKKYKEIGLSMEDICRLWFFEKQKGMIRLPAPDIDNIKSIFERKEKLKGSDIPVAVQKKK